MDVNLECTTFNASWILKTTVINKMTKNCVQFHDS